MRYKLKFVFILSKFLNQLNNNRNCQKSLKAAENDRFGHFFKLVENHQKWFPMSKIITNGQK